MTCLIRLQHPVHLVFREGSRDRFPRERTVFPGIVDRDWLRAMVRAASHVNGRARPLPTRLGPVLNRWRPRAARKQ